MIVSCAPDLMMRSKIDVAARHYGVEAAHAASVEQARALIARHGDAVGLVLVDLDLAGEPTVDLVAHARATTPARVVGFCSHLRTDLIRAAREAGAHTLMANSTFAAGVVGLVATLASESSGTAASSMTSDKEPADGNL